MTTHEILVKARALIEREEDWSPSGWGDDSRCMLHAASHAQGRSGAMSVDDPVYEVLRVVTGQPMGEVGRWNDSHSHAEVLAAFDRAIEATAPEPDTDFLNEVRVEEPVSA